MKEVWLDFEKMIREKSKKESIVSFFIIKSLAEKCGIHEQQEIIEALKYLSDLGSVQYFENKR